MTKEQERSGAIARASHARRLLLLGLVAALVSLAGCSSSIDDVGSPGTTGPSAPTTSHVGSGVEAGYRTDSDALSPLLITAVAPDPISVTGTDGKVHVAYELSVLNFSPVVATLTRLETLEGGPDGTVVNAIEGDALAERTFVVVGETGARSRRA